MNYTVITYLLYVIISLGITIWVARTLFSNGKRFLDDIFKGDTSLADSVNKLLLVGFYLINIGYAVFALKVYGDIADAQIMIEKLSLKIGAIILVLGVMHFFNLFLLFTLRKRALTAPQ